MALKKLTSQERSEINALRDRAWAAGLTEATFSQIAKDPGLWERRIRKAERSE